MSIKRTLSIIVLAASFLLAPLLTVQATGYNSGITYGPYLQRVTKKAATIIIVTDESAELTLHYKRVGKKWKTVTGDAGTMHNFRISNLKRGQTYEYYFSKDDARYTRTNTFRTQKKIRKNDSLRLVAVGDSGLLNEEALQVALQIKAWRPDIITHTGDIAYYSGTQANYEERFFPVYGSIIAESPFYGSIGNHDYTTDEAGPYKDIFETPTNSGTKDYYSFKSPFHIWRVF